MQKITFHQIFETQKIHQQTFLSYIDVIAVDYIMSGLRVLFFQFWKCLKNRGLFLSCVQSSNKPIKTSFQLVCFISSISFGFFRRIPIAPITFSVCSCMISILSITVLINHSCLISQSDNSNVPAMSGSDVYSVSSNCDFCPWFACNSFLIVVYDVLGKRNCCNQALR